MADRNTEEIQKGQPADQNEAQPQAGPAEDHTDKFTWPAESVEFFEDEGDWWKGMRLVGGFKPKAMDDDEKKEEKD